jgi:hypothetical protein
MTVTWRVTWWVIWWVTWWIKSRQANYILYIESSHWADPGGIRIIHNNTLCVLYYFGRCCINWATEGSWAGWVRTWHYDYRMYIGTQEEAVHTLHPATHRTRLPKEERGLTIHWWGASIESYSVWMSLTIQLSEKSIAYLEATRMLLLNYAENVCLRAVP